jgi:hypothetical protein
MSNSSKIVKEHLSNDIGSIVMGDQAPEYLLPPAVQPEIYQHVITLKNSGYEQAGISQLSASSQKPAGLDSGKALREYNDIETERFMTVGHAYENFHMDLSFLSIECAKEIFKEDKNLSVKVPNGKFIKEIKWKDVNLKESDYIMKVYPVSSLPNDPAGRLQTVQEYVQAGFYTPRTAKRLLDQPDLEAVDDLQSAMEDYLHALFEKMIEDDEYTPPAPDDDLDLALELNLEYIAQGKRDNLPEEKMELLRTYNEQVILLQQKALPPSQPMGSMAGQAQVGSPQAPAQPMQANNMVPQVQQ